MYWKATHLFNGSFTNPHQFGIVEKIATNSSSACINILPFFQQCLLTVVLQWGNNNAYLMEYFSFTSQRNICIHHKYVNICILIMNIKYLYKINIYIYLHEYINLTNHKCSLFSRCWRVLTVLAITFHLGIFFEI